VLIPAGARLIGETKPVQTFGEARLAVLFHRLLMPDGRMYRLDQFGGLNQIGDAGLKDRVNQHYLATFGAARAVGLISGLAQFLGSAGLGRGDGDSLGRGAVSSGVVCLIGAYGRVRRFAGLLQTHFRPKHWFVW
jgi:type IV secretion system protein VirB10